MYGIAEKKTVISITRQHVTGAKANTYGSVITMVASQRPEERGFSPTHETANSHFCHEVM